MVKRVKKMLEVQITLLEVRVLYKVKKIKISSNLGFNNIFTFLMKNLKEVISVNHNLKKI